MIQNQVPRTSRHFQGQKALDLGVKGWVYLVSPLTLNLCPVVSPPLLGQWSSLLLSGTGVSACLRLHGLLGLQGTGLRSGQGMEESQLRIPSIPGSLPTLLPSRASFSLFCLFSRRLRRDLSTGRPTSSLCSKVTCLLRIQTPTFLVAVSSYVNQK